VRKSKQQLQKENVKQDLFLRVKVESFGRRRGAAGDGACVMYAGSQKTQRPGEKEISKTSFC
jgi:hypothetical protein